MLNFHLLSRFEIHWKINTHWIRFSQKQDHHLTEKHQGTCYCVEHCIKSSSTGHKSGNVADLYCPLGLGNMLLTLQSSVQVNYLLTHTWLDSRWWCACDNMGWLNSRVLLSRVKSIPLTVITNKAWQSNRAPPPDTHTHTQRQ